MKLRMRADGNGNLVESDPQRAAPSAAPTAGSNCTTTSPASSATAAWPPSAEVELDCDYDLKYENVIEAITAVSGDVSPDGQVIKLVEKIKFSPPRPQ